MLIVCHTSGPIVLLSLQPKRILQPMKVFAEAGHKLQLSNLLMSPKNRIHHQLYTLGATEQRIRGLILSTQSQRRRKREENLIQEMIRDL